MRHADKTYTFDVENLFTTAAPTPTATFELEAGQGVLKRGSLIAIDTDTGQGKLIASGNTATSFFVLTDDTDTGEETSTDGVGCTGYLSGFFNQNRLIVGEGYDFPTKDVEEMRKDNIYLQNAIPVKGV